MLESFPATSDRVLCCLEVPGTNTGDEKIPKHVLAGEQPADDGGLHARGVHFLVKDYWGCAAGWGRIFTTGLTIMGYIFSRATRMGSQIFGIFGIRKFW